MTALTTALLNTKERLQNIFFVKINKINGEKNVEKEDGKSNRSIYLSCALTGKEKRNRLLLQEFLLVILSCCLLISVGCKRSAEKPEQVKITESKGQVTDTLGHKNEPSTKPNPKAEKLRQEWDAYQDVKIVHSADGLQEGEKRMLADLVNAGRIIEELYQLQLYTENLNSRDIIAASANDLAKKIFNRNQVPWCLSVEDPQCFLIDGVSRQNTGVVFWPEGFSENQFQALAREINAKELYSPFTVVRESENGGYKAIPFAGFELFGTKMRQVAALLRTASEHAADESIKKFLLSRADSFLSLSPFPYDESDYDWIRIKGDWEVTVGPYEVYSSAFQTKAMFTMLIGREDKTITESLIKLKSRQQDVENSLSLMLGEDVYIPRKIDMNTSFRAVNVWAAFGDAKKNRGALLAYHLPNRGKAVDEGLYKLVILMNHAEAFDEITKNRAEQILSPMQLKYLSSRESVMNTAYHEVAHGLGANNEMRINDLEGRLTTVKEALRDTAVLFEELKAQTAVLYISDLDKKDKIINEETLKSRYVSWFIHTMGLLQYPENDTYSRVAAVAVGYLLDEGALEYDELKGIVNVVYEKMGEAASKLLKETLEIQLKGNLVAARSLEGRYVEKIPNNVYAIKGKPAMLRKSLLEKNNKNEAKSPSLRYEIKGI